MEITQRYGGPAVNVKLRHGFERLKPEQWAEIADSAGVPVDRLRQWVEADENQEAVSYWWDLACSINFEHAHDDAERLFGTGVEVTLEGRSGGWLVVKGLPDPTEENHDGEDEEGPGVYGITWDSPRYAEECLPPIAGSRVEGPTLAKHLADGDTLAARWAAFVDLCRDYCADVPYTAADLIAHNVVLPLISDEAEEMQTESMLEKVQLILDNVSDDDEAAILADEFRAWRAKQ